MPMPSLKPLVDAANLAYQQIREPKEASYLHQFATTAVSLVGYADTSGTKKSALGHLADLKLTGTIEEQNETLALGMETLLKHSTDGSNFKALSEILMQCAALASNPLLANAAAIQFELLPSLFTLQNELKDSKHPFFLELGIFFQAMENHVKELHEQEHQLTKKQLQGTLKDLQGYQHLNGVHSQAIKERDAALATTNMEKDKLKEKHRTQLNTQKTAFLQQERQMEALLEEKALELKDLNKTLEEKQKSLIEARQTLGATQQAYQQRLQILAKNKAAVVSNASQLKKLLTSTRTELDNAQQEMQKLKKKVNTLETEIENSCSEYIASHLKPRDNQLKAVTEELQKTKAQLAQARQKPIPDSLGTHYPQSGLYASRKQSKSSTVQAQPKHQFQPARNFPSS